ncbi:AMP-binding protein [Streptomyces sp. NPDC005336]|uniref:AMP-binding protein n=1 Tax=Streptomyces sp. NPDC005336 TaxID=3157035 RepID=UPI0033AEC5CF
MTTPEPVGQDLLDRLTTAVRAVPGVTDAAAVARRTLRTPTAPTLGPEPVTPAPGPEPVTPAPGTPAPASRASGAPADLDGGPLHTPADAPATLQEALRAAAELAPDKGTVFITKGNEDVFQSYPEQLRAAEHVLHGLRANGLNPGDAALLQFDDNRAYLTAFWACVLGGFVPTPVKVAPTYDVPNETNRKLHNAWNLLDRPVLLTDTATAPALAAVRTLWNEPAVRILTVDELAAFPADTDWFPATPDSPVLNLLTSGSTGVPKCVQHTNASVVARSLAVARHCGLDGDDVSLIWMPFDHVTVAMYNVRDVIIRCRHVNAKIEHFLSDPLLWLDWAEKHRATNTWAPNFAFAMINECAEQIRERRWDLSRLREITNAGEPVIAATSHRFLHLLAPHGLRPDAIRPVWGMSETCSGVTYTTQHRDHPDVGTVTIDQGTLSGAIRHTTPDAPGAAVLSTVGSPIPGVRLRVVADDGTVLPEDRMGELRIHGATMMSGYHANAEANAESYDDEGWFRTGDLAFVHDGEVVIAGRKKDQIIVRGANYLAHEIESVVERVDGVRVTFAAAAGIRQPDGSEQLAVFFVPRTDDPTEAATTADAVGTTLAREAGITPDLVVTVTESEFPKTTSGKIQRSALVAALEAGTYTDRVFRDDADEETGTATEAATADDTWLFRRQWTPSPQRGPQSGPQPGALTGADGVRLVFGEEEEIRALGLDGDGDGDGGRTPRPWARSRCHEHRAPSGQARPPSTPHRTTASRPTGCSPP